MPYTNQSTNQSNPRTAVENLIYQGAGAPTDGGSGTLAKVAPKGSIYIDVTNAQVYLNGGSKSSPTWKQLTRAA